MKAIRTAMLLGSAAGLVLATPAFAAGQAAETEAAPGEIIVTAQRRAESLNDVAMAVQAVDADTLQALRVTDVHFDPDFDLPLTADVYVRARYIQSTCKVRGYAEPPCIDPDATASEWTVTRVPIKPRELVRAAARNN